MFLINSDGYQALPGSCPDSDKIHCYSGNLFKQIRLFNIPTVGTGLSLSLYHNAQDRDFSGPLGEGWRHSAETRLVRADNSSTTITFRDRSGKPFDFQLVSGDWKLGEDGNFQNMRLDGLGSGVWQITYQPSGEVLEFQELPGTPIEMRLVRELDQNGNVIEYSYDGSGQLVAIIDGESLRQIELEWASGLLVGASDPLGNRYGLEYDSGRLSAVELPAGCRIEYCYDSEGRIESRVDRDGNSTLYSYDSGDRLVRLEEPEYELSRPEHAFSYSSVDESIYFTSTLKSFTQVLYTNPRGKVWEYRFNSDGTLWRSIDPVGRQRRCYYDRNQQLLHSSEGYARFAGGSDPEMLGPTDNYNNQLTRYTNDVRGNVLQTIHPNGEIDVYTYDSNSRVTSVRPARAHLGIGGQWKGHFGEEGIILCAAAYSGDDIQRLPNYLSSLAPVLRGDGISSATEFLRRNVDHYNGYTEDRASWEGYIAVPTTPQGFVPSEGYRATEKRRAGYWTVDDAGRTMAFRLQVTEAHAFNLSLYTYCFESVSPVGMALQNELSGLSIQFEVTDSRGTQRYHCTQSAPGVWATFPVVADGVQPILVKARCAHSAQRPTITAVAFDPYEERGVFMHYDMNGNLVRQSEPTSDPDRIVYRTFSYNLDGTLEEARHEVEVGGVVTDSRVTRLFYQDGSKNLTRIEDPLYQDEAPVLMEYDLNGNVTAQVDAEGHRTELSYDERDRLVEVIDPLGNRAQMVYNGLGLLTHIVDALNRVTEMFYNPHRRLIKVRDAMGNDNTYTYFPDGLLKTVTDVRGNVMEFAYDDRGNRSSVMYPECEVVQTDFSRAELQPELRFAYDIWSRVVALTPPNGNQTDLSQIQVTNAANALRNPDAEFEGRRLRNTVDGWLSIPEEERRSTTESWTGDYSFPLLGNGHEWLQRGTSSHPGGRYLTRGAFKSTSVGATLELRAVLRDSEGRLTEQTSGPIEPGPDWELSDWARVDVAGEAQATQVHSAIHQFRVTANKPDPGALYADGLELLSLSSHQHFDGVYFNASISPDGGKTLTFRDRFGRPKKVVDADGRSFEFSYDASDRILSIVDSQGMSLSYEYDSWGNLTRFVDGRGKETLFAYDDLDRLLSLSQPVLSQVELFEYCPSGQLTSYTNCRGEQRQFEYDAAHRLVRIDYGPADFIALTYDAIGNLLTQQERNGDLLVFHYDALNRMVYSRRESSSATNWELYQQFDASGNRLALRQPSSQYGVARYGEASYVGEGPAYWSTPPNGIDPLNRRRAVADGLEQVTEFGYDLDGRTVEQASSNSVVCQSSYDITGRLMSQDYTLATASLWVMNYAYSLASDRLGQTSAWSGDGNSADYALDGSGRLVRETINRLTCWDAEEVGQGDLRDCALDRSGVIRILGYADDFQGQDFNQQRWQLQLDNPYQSQFRLVQDDGLHLAFPGGGRVMPGNYHPPGDRVTNGNVNKDYQYPSPYETFVPSASDHIPLSGCLVYLKHRAAFSGPFVVELDLSEVQRSNTDTFQLGFGAFVKTAENLMPNSEGGNFWGHGGSILCMIPGLPWLQFNQTVVYDLDFKSVRLEKKLVGSSWQLIASYFDGTSWHSHVNWWMSVPADDMLIYFFMHPGGHLGSVRLDDFRCSQAYPTCMVDSDESVNQMLWPRFESQVHDAGHDASWESIRWQETLASNTDVLLQIAVSASPEGPWNYVGPDGTADSYFSTPSGESLPPLNGQYGRFRAFLLSTDGLATPELSKVQIAHSGAAGSSIRFFTYDDAGNLLGIQSLTDAGIASESRTVNDLNQIVTRSGNWTYQYDSNGCMTVKSNGAGVGDERWEFTWDEDDRLTQASKGTYAVGGLVNDFTLDYTYDSMGRMLTRDDGTNATTFVWDGWDLLAETTSGVTTTYLVPDGQILSLIRGEDTYQVHTDGLGSVRMVTDAAGDVVARFEYGAWGNLLGGSFDNVPGGMPYRFVGSLGCRSDFVTGLVYMRHRWYDPELQRFISRDPIGLEGGSNLYAYAKNKPVNYVDSYGLRPGLEVPPGTSPQVGNPSRTSVLTQEEARQRLVDVSRLAPSVIFWWLLDKSYRDVERDLPAPVTDSNGRPIPQPSPGPSPIPAPSAPECKIVRCTVKCACKDTGTYVTGSAIGSNSDLVCKAAKKAAKCPGGNKYRGHCSPCQCS